MLNSLDDACNVESNNRAQKIVSDNTGFYFSLVNSLENIGDLNFNELTWKGLLYYFQFDVHYQAKKINVQLETEYDTNDEDEVERS